MTPAEPIRDLIERRIGEVERWRKRASESQGGRASHKLRTSIRRAEVALSVTPKRSLKEAAHKKLLARFRKLFRAAGAGRDIEIVVTRLRGHRGAAIDALVARLEAKRQRAERKLAQLASKGRPIALAIGEVDPERWHLKLDKRQAALSAELSFDIHESASHADVPALPHAARKAGKRLRYLLELRDEPKLRARLEQLAHLQDGLGLLHDIDMTLETLRNARNGRSQVRATSLDRAIAHEEAERRALFARVILAHPAAADPATAPVTSEEDVRAPRRAPRRPSP